MIKRLIRWKKASKFEYKLWQLIGCILLFACNEPKTINTSIHKSKLIVVPNLSKVKNLEIKDIILNVRYVVLDPAKKLTTISQICVNDKQIIILDKSARQITSFSNCGKLLYSFFCGKTENFNLTPQGIVFYDFNTSTISMHNYQGMQVYRKKIPRYGLELHCIATESLFFYLNGYSTLQKGSSQYGLSSYDQQFNFKGFMFKLKKEKIDNKNISIARFYASQKHLYYIPAFQNNLYRINKDQNEEVLRFDFGKNSLTDSIYGNIKNLIDFRDFPFVFDLSLIARTSYYSMFSFTFQHQEGYILLDNRNYSVQKIGLGTFADKTTQYNNFVPMTAFNNTFISIIDPAHFYINLKKGLTSEGLDYIRKHNISPFRFYANANHTLMLYELKH